MLPAIISQMRGGAEGHQPRLLHRRARPHGGRQADLPGVPEPGADRHRARRASTSSSTWCSPCSRPGCSSGSSARRAARAVPGRQPRRRPQRLRRLVTASARSLVRLCQCHHHGTSTGGPCSAPGSASSSRRCSPSSRAAAGQTQTKVFTRRVHLPGHRRLALPAVPGPARASREIEVDLHLLAHRHRRRLQLQRRRHRDLRPLRPRPGQRAGLPRLVGWGPAVASGSAGSGATPGYLPGPITPGRVARPARPLRDRAAGDAVPGDGDAALRPAGSPLRAAPAPTAVPGTGPGWYRGDLHLHTVHSDGKRTQAEMIAAARAAGLDFIGSSEHNTSSAYATGAGTRRPTSW